METQWSAVDPILGNGTPVHPYEPGTCGPDEPDHLIASDAAWVDPTVQEENGKELEK